MSDCRSRKRWLAILCALAAGVAAAADDAGRIMARADQYRVADGGSRLDSRVVVLEGEKVTRERSYTVLLQQGGKALVLFRDAAEAGQKVLVIGNEFWVIFPRSRRPVRISPLQRLIGDAATGDIALTSWSADYDAQLRGPEVVNGRQCLRLELKAKRTSVSYQSISLWVDNERHFPVAADLHVGSGRLAKKATFEMRDSDGRLDLVSMTLVDGIEQDVRTIVTYSNRRRADLPAEYFNPMYLVQNDVAF